MVGASASFFLLLSVVPRYATESGAGLATGALMLSTVLGELAAPRLVARYGYRVALIAGLTLLGAPALVLTVSDGMAWIVTVCLVRGLGFALTLVAGGALTASLIPAERRGEGLALVGVVSGVPSLIALPLGVWLAAHAGYGPVAVAAGVAALAAIVAVPGLPDREPTSGKPVGVLTGLRTGGLMRPGAVFATTALAAGIVVTFLPLAVPAAYGTVVAVALFVQPAASTAARWAAGRYGDRHGPARLLVPGLVLSAGGLSITAVTGSPVAVLVGVAVFGTGFGIAQNATLTLMYARPGHRIRHRHRAVEHRVRRWHGRRRGGFRRAGRGDGVSIGARRHRRTDAGGADPGIPRRASRSCDRHLADRSRGRVTPQSRGPVAPSITRRSPSVRSSAVEALAGSKSHCTIRPLSSAW